MDDEVGRCRVVRTRFSFLNSLKTSLRSLVTHSSCLGKGSRSANKNRPWRRGSRRKPPRGEIWSVLQKIGGS